MKKLINKLILKDLGLSNKIQDEEQRFRSIMIVLCGILMEVDMTPEMVKEKYLEKLQEANRLEDEEIRLEAINMILTAIMIDHDVNVEI